MDRWRKSVLAEIILFLILLSLNASIILAFISILLHEASHIIIAKKSGCKFNDFQIHIYGVNAELINIDELSKKEKIKIYLAGPSMNLAISCIFFFVSLIINNNIIIDKIISINLTLLFFNMLPAYPLDGSRILEIILSEKTLYKEVTDIISKISYIVAGILITSFLAISVYSKTLNISLVIAAIIICLITRIEKKSAMYILMGNIFIKRNKLLRNKYIENKTISVHYKLGLANVMTIIDKNRFNTFYILDDDLRVLFIMHEDELIEALKIYGNITLEEYFNKRDKNDN